MCVCVCEVGSYWQHALLFCCGHHMDHFLIQDWSISCFGGPARGWSPCRHHHFCERPPFPPPVSWIPISSTVSFTKDADRHEIMDVCCCLPKFTEALSFCCCHRSKSPHGIPFLLYGIPTSLLGVPQTTMVEQESPSNCFLMSWVGTCHVFISKAVLNVVMRFHGAVNGLLHSRHKMS